MKIYANLFIDRWGNLRVTKKDPRTNPSELGIQLVVDVPDVFFNRPIPQVTVKIPEAYLLIPDKEIAVNMIAEDVANNLELDIKTVNDGLLEMLANKQQSEGSESLEDN